MAIIKVIIIILICEKPWAPHCCSIMVSITSNCPL